MKKIEQYVDDILQLSAHLKSCLDDGDVEGVRSTAADILQRADRLENLAAWEADGGY